MSVSRGKFLKELGKSIPGLVLGGGVANAAQRVLGKIAAASGATANPTLAAQSQSTERATEAKIEFIKSGPTEGNRVALTFDDGPTPGVTDLILDELKRRKLHATFFMIGERIAASPELARRVLAEGHEAGNHTFTHPKLTTLADREVEAEIQKTQDIMGEVLQYRPVWFRPPYGALRLNQAGLVEKTGLRIVLWNVDPGDWSQPGEAKIAGTIQTETKPGSIIVCHDLYAQTAKAVGPILDGLLARGFSPVALSALME